MKVEHYLFSDEAVSRLTKLKRDGELLGVKYRERSVKNMSPNKNHIWYSVFEDEINLSGGEKLIVRSAPQFKTYWDTFLQACKKDKNHYDMACIADYEKKNSYKAMGAWSLVGEVESEPEQETAARQEVLNNPFSHFPIEEEMKFYYNYVGLIGEDGNVISQAELKKGMTKADIGALLYLIKLGVGKNSKRKMTQKEKDAEDEEVLGSTLTGAVNISSSQEFDDAVSGIIDLCKIEGSLAKDYKKVSEVLKCSKIFAKIYEGKKFE